MGDVAGPGGGGANVSAGGLGFGGDIGHGDVGYGSGQVDPGLAAAAGGPGAGSGLGQSVGSASAGGAGGEAEAERSIAAFRSAIARALGMSQIDREVTFGAPAQPGSPALEAHDMDTDAVRDALEAAGMFDDPSALDDPQGTEEGLSAAQKAVDAMDGIRGVVTDIETSPLAHLSTYHGQNTRNFNTTGFDPSRSPGLHDPQGTEAGLAAAQAAMDATDAPTGDTRTVGAHPSRDPRIGLPMGVGRPAPTDQQENREPVDMYGRVAPIEDIEDPEERALAYEILGKLQKQAKQARTPWGKALNNLFGLAMYGIPGMGMLNAIGKAVKAGMSQLGFNVDPNIIGQAMAKAHEMHTQGPDVNRPDSFLETFLNNLPASAYDEPWMKGLNERQIKYYLDRPSELEWVRNLWNQMNPS